MLLDQFCEDEQLLCDMFTLPHREEWRYTEPTRMCDLLSQFFKDDPDRSWAKDCGHGGSISADDAVAVMDFACKALIPQTDDNSLVLGQEIARCTCSITDVQL